MLCLLTDFYYNILIQHNGMDHIKSKYTSSGYYTFTGIYFLFHQYDVRRDWQRFSKNNTGIVFVLDLKNRYRNRLPLLLIYDIFNLKRKLTLFSPPYPTPPHSTPPLFYFSVLNPLQFLTGAVTFWLTWA